MLVRPGVEVVDVVWNIATVAAEDRALAVAAQALQQPARHLEIGCGLVGVEKRRAPLGAGSPGDVVVCIHGCRCPRCAIATLRPRHRAALRGTGPLVSATARRFEYGRATCGGRVC